MSETTPEPQAETKAETPATPKDVAAATTQGKPGETPEQTIEGLRAALAKANSEAKENRLAAKELGDLKQAQMTETEKKDARIKELEGAIPAAVAAAFREAAITFGGISEEDAETFLTGGDKETLTRQAQRLAALSASKSTPTTPKPDLTQGGTGAPPALNSSALEEALKAKLGIV